MIHPEEVLSAGFSPDGTRVILAWATIRPESAMQSQGRCNSLSVTSVSFSRDMEHVVSRKRDKSVRIRIAGTGGIERVLEGHSDSVRSVSF